MFLYEEWGGVKKYCLLFAKQDKPFKTSSLSTFTRALQSKDWPKETATQDDPICTVQPIPKGKAVLFSKEVSRR